MSKFKLGLQLYTIRDEMEKDMDACLKKVKEMGYECVEFAGFFGKSAEEVKAILDKYGLEAVSSHQTVGIKDDEPLSPEDTVKYLNTLGVKYCAIPWYGKENYVEDFDGTMEKFKKSSEILKKGGIDLYYHNHDFEFDKIDGKTIHDKIFETLGTDVIKPELDVCWVNIGGENPADYIRIRDVYNNASDMRWAKQISDIYGCRPTNPLDFYTFIADVFCAGYLSAQLATAKAE